METKTSYILDTNVLLSDCDAIKSFGKHNVILPFAVIEELDKHKSRQDEVGRNGRENARRLSELTKSGSIKKGVEIAKGKGNLIVISNSDLNVKAELPSELEAEKSGDNKIIQFCLNYKASFPESEVVLVTKDILLQLKCDSIGVKWEDYKKFNVAEDSSTLFGGVTVLQDMNVSAFYDSEDDFIIDEETELKHKFYSNQFLVMKDVENRSAIVRYIGKGKPVKGVTIESIDKLKLRNKEQQFGADLLMDPKVSLVSLAGKAGSGKSLLAIAAGLEQVIGSQKRYKTLVICRPVISVGKEIGFLPGPQPLTAKILTPTGWTTMGQLKIGDLVVARDGTPTKVFGIFPKGKKEVFKITTTDGSTECCEDHLWYTRTAENHKRQNPGSVKPTIDIINSLKKNGKNNHFLPRNEPIHFNSKSMPIPPYLLGALLGDGSIGNSISLAGTDKELINRAAEDLKLLGCEFHHVEKTIGYNIKKINGLYNNKPARKVILTNIETNEIKTFNSNGLAASFLNIHKATCSDRCLKKATVGQWKYEFLPLENRWQNPVKEELSKLGLVGTKAPTKFIPEIYKFEASISDRLSLLQGLMDTDGTIKKNGEASFTTISKQLALDVVEIVRSLGGRAILRSRNRVGKFSIYNNKTITTKHISYEFNISLPNNLNPFFISRKANRHKAAYIHKIGIEKIESLGLKEVQCIKIEHPEHLYITYDHIIIL